MLFHGLVIDAGGQSSSAMVMRTGEQLHEPSAIRPFRDAGEGGLAALQYRPDTRVGTRTLATHVDRGLAPPSC